MKKLNLVVLILLIGLFSNAQNYAKLTISNVKVVIDKGDTLNGNTFDVDLMKGSKNRGNILFSNGDVTIEAAYKVVAYNSRRSSVKTGAINIRIAYKTKMNGKKDKRNTEQIFYLDDERKFTVNESFVIKNGLYSKQIKLRYTGQMSPN